MPKLICFLLWLLIAPWVAQAPAAASEPPKTGPAFISQDAVLRASPAENAASLAPLPRGTTVKVQVSHKEWVRVEAPALALTGWVLAAQLTDQAMSGKESTGTAPIGTKKTIAAENRKTVIKKTTTAAPSSRPQPLIGVIDIQQVIDRSQRGQAAREKFEELRRAGGTADLNQAEQKIISRVIVEIRALVEKYARAKGFTHILNSNSGTVFYNEASFDITGDIIREYDREQPAPPQPK